MVTLSLYLSLTHTYAHTHTQIDKQSLSLSLSLSKYKSIRVFYFTVSDFGRNRAAAALDKSLLERFQISMPAGRVQSASNRG